MQSFPYKLLWDFGDGEYSTETNPEHRYTMPGLYSPVLILFDSSGTEHSKSRADYIRVSDWDLDGLHVSYTNRCLRVAVDPQQGVGIVRWGGDNWVWPEGIVGTCRGATITNDPVLLVLDNKNGKFWRLGITDLWTDKTNSYGGQEIPTSFRLPERVAPGGEFQKVEHIESHVYVRPYADEYKGATGYDSNGFRSSHAVSALIYKDGYSSPESTVERIPLYADVAHRSVQGHRLQTEIETVTSAYRCIGVDEDIQVIDKVNVTNALPERQWQRDWRTPLLWISRSNPLLDRVTGVDLEGSYDSLTTGPDSETSALLMGVADTIEFDVDAMTGDFSLCWWMGSLLSAGNIWSIGDLTIAIDAAGDITWTDGVNSHTLSSGWGRSTWAHFAVQRNGNRCRLLVDGQIADSAALSDGSLAYGTAGIIGGAAATLFDMRIVPRTIEQKAAAYYYANIVSYEGSVFLPRMVG